MFTAPQCALRKALYEVDAALLAAESAQRKGDTPAATAAWAQAVACWQQLLTRFSPCSAESKKDHP